MRLLLSAADVIAGPRVRRVGGLAVDGYVDGVEAALARVARRIGHQILAMQILADLLNRLFETALAEETELGAARGADELGGVVLNKDAFGIDENFLEQRNELSAVGETEVLFG